MNNINPMNGNNWVTNHPNTMQIPQNNMYNNFNTGMNTSQNMGMQQPNMQPTYIPGRFISNPEEVTPREVPMDGNIGLFPMLDGSAIYTKAWGNKGLIETDRYVLDKPIDQNGEQSDPIAMIMQRLDNIEKMLRRPQSKKYNNKNNYNKYKQKEQQETAKEEE